MRFLFTTIVLIVFCLQLHAQPGTLDHNFGNEGKVTSENYGGLAYTSLVQPDGKIVVGGASGYYYKEGNLITGSLIVRYNEDGGIDLSFGDSGRAIYDFEDKTYSKTAYSLGLQKDGKIVAAVRGFSSSSVAIIRLNENGSIDKSFGNEGLATMLGQDALYSSKDMALLPDGRMLITGDISYDANDQNRSFISCFTTDGFLDKSFGDEGTAIIELKNPMDITSIATTKEGKIIVGGEYNFSDETILLRYNNDGSSDKSFGKNGVANMLFVRNISLPMIKDIAITSDNMIAATGYATLNSGSSVILVNRFLENGKADSSFGTNGYSTTKYGDGNAKSYAIAVQDNGKIVCAGYSVQGSSIFTAIRYDQYGFIDSSFGVNGVQTTRFVFGDIAYSVLIQKDGKIVLTGNTLVTQPEAKSLTELVRYNGDESRREIIVTKIKKWIQHHGITWQTNNGVRYYNVQRSLDGGVTYQPVAKIYNNRQPQYNYEEATLKDNSLYRIIAIGKDGSRNYSNSLLINSEASVSVFPNPVRNSLQVQGLATNGKTNISISDFTGNVHTSAVASGNTYSLSTANLKPGNYLLKIQNSTIIVTQTIVKE